MYILKGISDFSPVFFARKILSVILALRPRKYFVRRCGNCYRKSDFVWTLDWKKVLDIFVGSYPLLTALWRVIQLFFIIILIYFHASHTTCS